MPKLHFYFVTPPEMRETDIIWLIGQAEALFHWQIEEKTGNRAPFYYFKIQNVIIS